jgi:hypothetical protein
MNTFMSLIVISYENPRELPRTLFSLSPQFQQGISADDYEVIVVDNGSKQPPSAEDFAHLGLDLTVLHMDDPVPSPVRAVNRGLNSSCGAAMGVFIDGARLASPGLLRRSREALTLHPRAVVGARGRYLGPLMQRRSMKYGYDQAVEDRLLEKINWTKNGYDLFSISIFDETSRPVWHAQVGETNALFMGRPLWRELGGYDEAFRTPGGGFVNLDAWERACNLPGVSPILLLGEATFHQFHGGVATNAASKKEVDVFRQEYIEIHGRDHKRPTVPVSFWGSFAFKPPADEFVWDTPAQLPDRMSSGPMKGLLDMSRPVHNVEQVAGKGPKRKAPVTAGSRAVRVRRAVGRRLPPRVKRVIRRTARRVRPR